MSREYPINPKLQYSLVNSKDRKGQDIPEQRMERSHHTRNGHDYSPDLIAIWDCELINFLLSSFNILGIHSLFFPNP